MGTDSVPQTYRDGTHAIASVTTALCRSLRLGRLLERVARYPGDRKILQKGRERNIESSDGFPDIPPGEVLAAHYDIHVDDIWDVDELLGLVIWNCFIQTVRG